MVMAAGRGVGNPKQAFMARQQRGQLATLKKGEEEGGGGGDDGGGSGATNGATVAGMQDQLRQISEHLGIGTTNKKT